MGLYKDTWRYDACCNENVSLEGTFLKDIGIMLHKLPRDIGDFGYIVEEANRIVCVFRGTINAKQWISNFDFAPLAEGKTIHEGFYNSWTKFKDDVSDIISEYVDRQKKQNLPVNILCVGHSRGSALACLCARHIAKNLGLPCRFIGYGCPNVGNSTFAAEFELLPLDAMKVQNGWDFIAYVPPEEMGFRPVGKTTYIPEPFWHHIFFIRCNDHVQYEKDLARTNL